MFEDTNGHVNETFLRISRAVERGLQRSRRIGRPAGVESLCQRATAVHDAPGRATPAESRP